MNTVFINIKTKKMSTAEGKKKKQEYMLKYRIEKETEIAIQKKNYYKRNRTHLLEYQKWYDENKKHLQL